MGKEGITTSKRLIHNTFFNMARLVSNAVVAFILVRFFFGQLGEFKYGVWVLIASIFHYRTLLSMGLNSSINRYIPVYLAKDDTRAIRRIISTALFFFSLLAVVLALLTLVIYCNLGSWFEIRPELLDTARRLVLVVGFCFAFAMPLQLSSAVLSGLQRYDIIGLAEILPLLLRTVMVVVLLLRGYGLIAMGLTYGMSEILMRMLQFGFARKLLPHSSPSLANIDLKLLREMLAYGVNTFLYAMGAIIIYKASDLVIGALIGTAEVSRFSIAAAGVLLLSQLLQAFSAAIKPAVSDLDARNEHAHVKEIALLTQKYSLLMIIPAGCFLIAMGRQFLWVYVGDRFEDPTVIDGMGVILAILAVAHCLRLAQHSNFLVLVGRGEHRIFGIFAALGALLCVLGAVISVKFFNWGLLGVAWSNFLPMVLISGLILPIYFNRKMKISARDSVLRVWRPALLGCLPSVALILLWKYLSPPDSWIEIAGVVFAAMVVTLAGSWFLSLDTIERKRFVRIFERKPSASAAGSATEPGL